MERCPSCTARLAAASQCPRCQADLSYAINAEHAARLNLARAIQLLQENALEQCLAVLQISLQQHQTELALQLRAFLIQQQTKQILVLLAEQQLFMAKQQLYRARLLLPHSPLLRQLQGFSDYLLARQNLPDTASSLGFVGQ